MEDIWLRGFTSNTPTTFWKSRAANSLASASHDDSEALGLGGLSPTYDDVVVVKKKDDPTKRGCSPIGDLMNRDANARKRSSSWDFRIGQDGSQPSSWESNRLTTNLLSPSPSEKQFYSLPVSPRLPQSTSSREPTPLGKAVEYYQDESGDDYVYEQIEVSRTMRTGSFAEEPLGALPQSEHEEFLSSMGGMEMEADGAGGYTFAAHGGGFGGGGMGHQQGGYGAPLFGSLSSPFPLNGAQSHASSSSSAPVLRPHAQLHPTILGHSPPAIVTTHSYYGISPAASPSPHSPLSVSPSPHSISPLPISVSPMSPSPISPSPLSPRSPTSPVDEGDGFGESPNAEHPLGEHPSRTLFVRNINSNVEDEELYQVFSMYGPIRSMYTQCKHRGFVMISYFDIRHAKNAMRHLQGRVVRRRKIDIHYSIPKENPSEKDQNQGTLVVFNLDPSTTNEEIKIIFGTYGEIKEVRETPNKKHHKFIEFYDVRDAERAMKSLNKTEIKGKKIKIEPSRPGGARKSPAMMEAEEEHMMRRQPLSSPPSERAHSAPVGYFPAYMNGVKSPILSPNHMEGLSTSMLESLHLRDFPQQPPQPMPQQQLPQQPIPQQQQVSAQQHPAAAMMGGGPRFVVGPGTNTQATQTQTQQFSWASATPSVLNKNALPFIVSPPSSQTGIPVNVQQTHNPTTAATNAAANTPAHYPPLNSSGNMSGMSSYLAPSQAPTQPMLQNNPVPHNNFTGGGGFSHSLAPGSAVQNPMGGTTYRFPLNLNALAAANISPKMSPRMSPKMSPKSQTSDSEDEHLSHTPPTPGRKFDSDKSPRGRHRGDSSSEDKSQYILNMERVLEGHDPRTTLMIKNIPNKYSQKMLLAAIDESHKGLYDFFYLPIDFKNKCNVGYAFINFIHYASIPKFYQEFNNKKWEKFNSEKVCEITYARIQGKNALIQHFQNSSLMCEDKKCRPIIFHSEGPNMGEQPFPIGPNVRARKGSKEDSTKPPTHTIGSPTPTKENGLLSSPTALSMTTNNGDAAVKLNNIE